MYFIYLRFWIHVASPLISYIQVFDGVCKLLKCESVFFLLSLDMYFYVSEWTIDQKKNK